MSELPPPEPLVDAAAEGSRVVRPKSASKNGLGWQPLSAEAVAALLPQYEISAMLGFGGMGAVYFGRQAMLDRPVAVKLLAQEISTEPVFSARFLREARAMARLSHPNIAAVYGFGQTSEGHLYLVMEYVDGADLRQLIRAGKLTPERVLHLFRQVCEALEYAHQAGVIHRDIKPSNVLVNREGRAKLADFGLARLSGTVDDETHQFVTQTGAVMGTPAYMAPEQKDGMPTDERADIYSLGILLYEALTGRVPHGIFVPPSQRAKVDGRIDELVQRALQEEPENRFQSTTDLKMALDHAQAPPAPEAPPAVLHGTRLARALRPGATRRSAALLLVATVGVVTAAMLWQNRTPRAADTPPWAANVPLTHPASTPPAPKSALTLEKGQWVPIELESQAFLAPKPDGVFTVHGSVLVPGLQATDLVVRASVRLRSGDPFGIILSARVTDGRGVRCHFRPAKCSLESLQAGEYLPDGQESFPSLEGKWTALEFTVSDRTVHANVGGVPINAIPLVEAPAPGGLEIVAVDADIKDLAVMLLDGITAEAVPATPAPDVPTPAALSIAPVATKPKPASPRPAAAPRPQSEVATWLALVDAQYQDLYEKEALQPYVFGMADLRKNYADTLERQISASSRGARVTGLDRQLAVSSPAAQMQAEQAWRNERQRYQQTGDESVPATNDDLPSAAVAQLRAAFRAESARLERERNVRAKAVFDQYEKVLKANIGLLTQRQRFDDALLLQKKRDEVAGKWLPTR